MGNNQSGPNCDALCAPINSKKKKKSTRTMVAPQEAVQKVSSNVGTSLNEAPKTSNGLVTQAKSLSSAPPSPPLKRVDTKKPEDDPSLALRRTDTKKPTVAIPHDTHDKNSGDDIPMARDSSDLKSDFAREESKVRPGTMKIPAAAVGDANDDYPSDGFAEYEWADGSKYSGFWLSGMLHGMGKLTMADGATYEGEFACNRPHGKGSSSWPDGYRFEGEWQRGKRHGWGVDKWPDGNRYEGEWKDGLVDGKGTREFPDGRRYVGDWKYGKKCGRGSYEWKDGRKYDGEWENDRPSGHGIGHWPDGHRYEGGWLNGKRHGKGDWTTPDGRAYCLEWFDDKPHSVAVNTATITDAVERLVKSASDTNSAAVGPSEPANGQASALRSHGSSSLPEPTATHASVENGVAQGSKKKLPPSIDTGPPISPSAVSATNAPPAKRPEQDAVVDNFLNKNKQSSTVSSTTTERTKTPTSSSDNNSRVLPAANPAGAATETVSTAAPTSPAPALSMSDNKGKSDAERLFMDFLSRGTSKQNTPPPPEGSALSDEAIFMQFLQAKPRTSSGTAGVAV